MKKTILGILGGGQLGRMSAQAAQKLGIETIIFTPEEDSPASQVVSETIVAAYEDQNALTAFADKVDVISYEFENIPVETVQFLQEYKPVHPGVKLLDVSQDRLREKKFLNDTGINTTRWTPVLNVSDIEKCFKDWDTEELILKTTRFGYDGKGQERVSLDTPLQNVLDLFNGAPLIAEEIINFNCEVSVIIARDQFGTIQTYGPVLNEHKNHILDRSTAPAPIDSELAAQAISMTTKLAEKINLIGVMALEMFVTDDGRLLANEIAPRTHNSGHWTIDACTVSQFENHVRAVCGLPVLAPDQHSPAEMINLIGDDVNNIIDYESQENAYIHLYGKHDIKPGRKMGHVTILQK